MMTESTKNNRTLWQKNKELPTRNLVLGWELTQSFRLASVYEDLA